MRRKVPKPDIHLKPEHTGHTAIQPMNEVLELDVSSFDDVSKEISGGEASIFEAENVFVLSLWIEGKNDPVKYTFSEKGLEELAEEIRSVLGRGAETSTPQPPLAGDGTQLGDGSQLGERA